MLTTVAVLVGLIVLLPLVVAGVAAPGWRRSPPAAPPPLEELAWAYRSPAPSLDPPATMPRRGDGGARCARELLRLPLHTTEADMAAWREELLRHPF